MTTRKANKRWICLAVILYLTGCGAASESDQSTAAPNNSSAGVARVELVSDASTVDYDGSITLNWTTSQVQDCVALGDWSGNKSASGSETIDSLMANSTFELACYEIEAVQGSSIAVASKGKRIKASLGISVSGPKQPTLSVSASTLTVSVNGMTTISWSSKFAKSCTASGDWSGSLATAGSQTTGTLTADSTFNITCSGAGGSASDSVSVTVAAPLGLPTVSLSASPSNLPSNGTTTLSWNTTNTTDCTASGDWSGDKATSGSQTMSALISNSSFSLTCSGAGGSATESVNVTVATPLPTLSLSANPSTISQNSSTTLNWSAIDATSCTASGDWSGTMDVSGAVTISSLTVDSQFILTCSGSNGTVNETVNVTVNALVKPSVNLSTENNSIYLSWSQSNANQYRVLYWEGNNAPQEQLTTSTEYTFPSLSAGLYTVIVEAYDIIGNSLFSAPVMLEVL